MPGDVSIPPPGPASSVARPHIILEGSGDLESRVTGSLAWVISGYDTIMATFLSCKPTD